MVLKMSNVSGACDFSRITSPENGTKPKANLGLRLKAEEIRKNHVALMLYEDSITD